MIRKLTSCELSQPSYLHPDAGEEPCFNCKYRDDEQAECRNPRKLCDGVNMKVPT